MNCHQCGIETDYTCDQCGEPVCEDCCVPMTYHNQIDYPLCTTCHGINEDSRSSYYHAENEKRLQEDKARQERNAKSRANYHKPENVEKRKQQKLERKRQEAELARKWFEEAMNVVGSMMR